MKPQDREAFAALMAGVGELYGKSLSPQLIAIYWEGLKDFAFAEVKAAVNTHVRNPDTGQFMPKIADVVKFIEGNTITQAMRAWQKVLDAVRLVGTYQSVVFDDPLIHCAISDMGGWQSIGLISDADLPFKAREFEKRYQSYCVKGPASHPRKLIGIFEQQNSILGFQSEPPVLIGDTRQAQLVYDGGVEHAALTVKSMNKFLPNIKDAA
jgi:hypothetical protein